MPKVNHEILSWARETAGLSLSEAVGKLGIWPRLRVSAVDRLAAIEAGEVEPTVYCGPVRSPTKHGAHWPAGFRRNGARAATPSATVKKMPPGQATTLFAGIVWGRRY
jgi:hypothetical protein